MLEFLNEELKGIDIRVDEPLKEYIYTRVGGSADYLAFPRNRYELARIVTFANKNDIPWMVLGNVSNIVVRDGDIRGFIVMLDKLGTVMVNGCVIEAEVGANLIEATRIAKFHSSAGFEFACGIPGSTGGAVLMNAGAYGGEISHISISAQVITKEGEIKTTEAHDVKFDYRHSAIQDSGGVVISAEFALKSGDYVLIEQEMTCSTHLRKLKRPLGYPSCGFAFKHLIGHSAGQLINGVNLRGHRIGGVGISRKHAGSMVNVADGNARDYEGLIVHIINTAEQSSGARLEREIRIIGEKKR